jgi:tryptophan synthase alpha chain
MSRIDKTFQALRRNGDRGLITYITGGDPGLPATLQLLLAMARSGADIIEVGIPFSDPIADGPVIQAASNRALAHGVTVDGILETISLAREKTAVPLVLMTYYNPIFQYGLEPFCRMAVKSGADGLIVPDLPLEESGPLRVHADRYGIDLIPLIAPTSTPERVTGICAQARGFVYCVAVTGVTGARERIETDLAVLSGLVRGCTSHPVAIGFGISGPEAASRAASYCDAVVVGSAIVSLVAQNDFKGVELLTADLKKALKSSRFDV